MENGSADLDQKTSGLTEDLINVFSLVRLLKAFYRSCYKEKF